MLRKGMLTWLRRKIIDPFRHERYVSICWFVPKPTTEDPYPCLMLSISNGPRSRVMFRFANLQAFDDALYLTGDERARINVQVAEAQFQAAEIWEDKRLTSMRRGLSPGEVMTFKRKEIARPNYREALPAEDYQDYLCRLYPGIDTDTGEIVAEAEQIINGKGNQIQNNST